MKNLAHYLEASATDHPDRVAVVDSYGRTMNYRELDGLAARVAGFLVARGIHPGDRVGLILPKSAIGVAAIFGILKARAAYVPVDYTAPATRNRAILSDCDVRAVFVDQGCLDSVPFKEDLVVAVIVGGDPAATGRREGSELVSWEAVAVQEVGSQTPATADDQDLAYILYTSGSTGIPKGVMLRHENACSFVDWCSSVLEPEPSDRFSSHAPFHFDLSVLDLYVPIKHGAAVYVISENIGKSPKDLAAFIGTHALTVWYSTPSILSLLAQFGGIGEIGRALRLVLFAGEVFPVKHLRDVTRLWPQAEYYNLYGPTETNVCTFARIPLPVPDDRTSPYPIGPACSHCLPLVLDDGEPVAGGGEGLLYISGPSVFHGYWNRPVENAKAFLDRDGVRWYNTGDVVREDTEEGFIYLGRRDRMVKRRGYRIELGEIERALYQHPGIREAAVVSLSDSASGVKIVAHVTPHEAKRPSIIELKTFCAGHLPSYMSPDVFLFHENLPRTSTDKVDYQRLTAAMAAQ